MQGYFGSIECRNVKYQGFISEASFCGLGILLSSDFLFVLSRWEAACPVGATLIYFPQGTHLFGTIIDRRMHGLWHYFKSPKLTFYILFEQGVAVSITRDDHTSVVSQRNLRTQTNSTQVYTTETEKQQAFQNMFGLNATQQNANQYARKNFSEIPIEIAKNGRHYFIGFKSEPTLGIKTFENGQLRQIGSFKDLTHVLEYGKKHERLADGSLKIEEGHFENSGQISIYKSAEERPLIAKKQLEETFKRGTNFANTFVKLNLIEDITSYVQNIEKELINTPILEFGQKIIENPSSLDQPSEALPTKEYTLAEIRKEIYSKVSRREGNSKRASPFEELRMQMKQNLSLSGQKHTRESQNYPITEFTLYQVPMNTISSKPKMYNYDEKAVFKEEKKSPHTIRQQNRRAYDYSQDTGATERAKREIPPFNIEVYKPERRLNAAKNLEGNNREKTPYENYLKYKNRNKQKDEELKTLPTQHPRQHKTFTYL